MVTINTNYAASFAANAAKQTQSDLNSAMEKLSTGKRINFARDDAAGIALAMRLEAEISELSVASRNASDGQALIDTADGALKESHNVLIRMRELAVQASNGTYTAQDRIALQAEVGDLQSEINRIATDTTWNNIGLLSGAGSTGVTFQIGADNTQTMTVSISRVTISTMGINISTANQLTTAAAAMVYISTIDTAISIISTNRGTYAAAMNRLDHAIANMQNVATNLSAAKGRIEDTDFAAETSNLARVQVLQQASMAMLAQANASKQNILSLFQ